MTIDTDDLDRLRELAAEGLDQDGGIAGAFKAGQWAEGHREELCRAVLRLIVEVQEQRAVIEDQSEVIEELNFVVDQLMYGQIYEQVQREVWE